MLQRCRNEVSSRHLGVDDGLMPDMQRGATGGSARGDAASRGTILLVEDNRADAILIRELVREWPPRERLEVIQVASLAAATDALRGLTPACILLDLGLPDADGSEVVREMRAVAPDIPIVVLTGLDDDDVGAESLRSGAQDYLVKGEVQASLLKRCVHQAAERIRVQAGLQQLALYDALTGVSNRVLFNDRFETALARARRRGRRLAVMVIDLDLFKDVNDRLGHAAGDDVLRAVANQMGAALRSEDTLARLGGDEFGVLCEDASHREEICAVAERLLAAIATPIALASGTASVQGSIGIAFARFRDQSEAVLRHADRAMYAAKSRGHGRFEVFDDVLGS
jgi:diguanylate cyclase (GGDEF)-like protein